jgi:hypothetical protein
MEYRSLKKSGLLPAATVAREAIVRAKRTKGYILSNRFTKKALRFYLLAKSE